MSKIDSGTGSRTGGIIIANRRSDDLLGIAFQDARTASPNSSSDRVLYRLGDDLYYWNGTSAVLIGAAGGGGGGIPSFDAIFASDKTLNVAGTTFTIDNSAGANNVLTLTNTGAGAGHVIQITNVGSGKDINGTSDTWSVTKTGVAVFLSETLSGTGGSTVFTITAGDAVMSDGSLAITDADNAATFSVTNDTATSASVFVWAGSGAFTGNTTSAFFTLTPSGLTTGTALYLPVAALTTGKALHIVANAATSGKVVNITSSATAITGAGRLLHVDHSGNAGSSATLVEVSSAAADETVIFKVTASAALALGTAVSVSASSLTTGKAIAAADLDALTTGIGVHIASAATAITTTGRLFYSNHTGATGTTAILNEFASAANDETEIVKITASDVLAAGKALNISVAAMTTGTAILVTGTAITSGKGLNLSGFDALTTGIMLNITSAATAITGAGRMVYVNHTGATGTSATLFEVASAANDETIIAQITASAANAAGVALAVTTATTTGKGISITGNSMTDGILLSIASSATGGTSTGRLMLINHSGNAGVSHVVAEIKSAAADETVVFQVLASAALAAGKVVNVSGAAVTTGTLLSVADADALTTGGIAVFKSNSADVTARNLVLIHNDNSAAVGSIPLVITQDAESTTHFKKIIKLGSVQLYISDGTTANAALSGTAGDICFNAGSNKPEYCTGTTNWTALV